jgi:hypothetical protein
MNDKLSIQITLEALGYPNGWAGDDIHGITVWINDDPQPTEEQLVAAGWIKQDPPDA